jgi:hypothetical protein
MGMQLRLQDLCSQWSRNAAKQVNPRIDLDHEAILLQAPVVKSSKYRAAPQKRWCVLTEERVYFFESFAASKFSAPTEAVAWSRVLFVRYACSGPEKRSLTICCKSRLLGIRSVHVDLFGGGDDMDAMWCECFAKLSRVSFFAALDDPRKAPPLTAAASAEKLAEAPPAVAEERKPGQVSDAVDASSRTSTGSTSGTALRPMRRIPKMSQIAPQRPECECMAAVSGASSDLSSWPDMDATDSVSSDSIASDAFIEDPDIRGLPFTFQNRKDMSSADLCAYYQSSKEGSASISTMDSDTALGTECDASSYVASEIGDDLSDALSNCILTRVQDP